MAENQPLDGRIALITGASRGIGRAAALALATAGAHVVILARTEGGLEDLDDEISSAGFESTLVPMNLTDFKQVDALGPSLLDRFGKLDILIGNAAILGPMSPIGHVKDKIWDDVIATNLTANYRLIRTLDPLLRLSDAGRAIFLTSGVTRSNPGYWGPYTTSKAGLEALVKTWANELQNSSIRANLLDPGIMRTQMREKAFPGEDPLTVPTPDVLGPVFIEMCHPDYQKNGETVFYQDVETAKLPSI